MNLFPWGWITNTSLRNILCKHKHLTISTSLSFQISDIMLNCKLLFRWWLLSLSTFTNTSIKKWPFTCVVNIRVKLWLNKILTLTSCASPCRSRGFYFSSTWGRSVLSTSDILRTLSIFSLFDRHRNHSIRKYTCLSLDLKYEIRLIRFIIVL